MRHSRAAVPALALLCCAAASAHEGGHPQTLDVLVAAALRWMHILPAVIMAGGSFFMLFVLNPALGGTLDPDTQLKVRGAIIKRWKIILHTCIALFLLSGFYNYLAITRHQHDGQALYHALFGIKFLLAMVVFFLAICLTSTKNWAGVFRKNTPFWARVIVMLAIWIILIAGYMKVMPTV